jgi:hypothetical protein
MGEQSGLLTRTATMESGSSCNADELLTAFLELEGQIKDRSGRSFPPNSPLGVPLLKK